MTVDLTRAYCNQVINAAPFADNEAGIPQMVDLIAGLRDALDAANARADAAVADGMERAIKYAAKWRSNSSYVSFICDDLIKQVAAIRALPLA